MLKSIQALLAGGVAPIGTWLVRGTC